MPLIIDIVRERKGAEDALRVGRSVRLGDGFFFNPGSVGLAYRHNQSENSFRLDPWAEYAVLDVEGERDALEFRKVPFDVSALLHIYRDSGRPFAEDAVAQYSPLV